MRRAFHAPYARGAIRARDGEILASGPASNRVYPQGAAFSDVTGYVKTPDPTQVGSARGFRLAGDPALRPGGARGVARLDPRGHARGRSTRRSRPPGKVDRSLALNPGQKPQDVVTTLRVHTQHDAAEALGSRYGGVVVLDPKSGAVEASVGIGSDALQPPGSSFKTVTAVGGAEREGRDAQHRVYPYARYIELNGWKLHNFHKESCGGIALARVCGQL